MALRIKDSVDLKELEKFGFIEYPKIHDWQIRGMTDEEIKDYINNQPSYYGYKIENVEIKVCHQILKLEGTIEISSDDRKIKMARYVSKYQYEIYNKFVETVLYDLIKAGLVEKVDDN